MHVASRTISERGIETAIERDGLHVQPLDISSYRCLEVDFQADLDRANTVFARTDRDPSRGDCSGALRAGEVVKECPPLSTDHLDVVGLRPLERRRPHPPPLGFVLRE